MIQPSLRMNDLTPHFFAALSAQLQAMRAAGYDVIRLDEGSPDLPPHSSIVAALTQAASSPDKHGYQPHKGPLALRMGWAEMYARVFDVLLDPEREILPLLGSKEGIFHVAMAFIDPGQVVLIPDPGYITYTRSVLFAGGAPYYLPLKPENAYLPDLEAIPADVLQRAKMLWLNYPNNPTTATASPDFLADAVVFARRHNLLICHDAAYTQVTFEGYRAPSLLQTPGAKEVSIEFNTLSKSHNMAGWRVAAAVGNRQVLQSLYNLKTNVDSSHYLPVLEAAATAMLGDQSWLDERNQVYCRRRDLVTGRLASMGLRASTPRASIYVWCAIPEGYSSLQFSVEALDDAHVSLTPGTVFGANGEGYVRLSLTSPDDRIEEAMQRLAKWMGR